MKNCNLYVILDKKAIGKKDVLKTAVRVLSGGADIIQLRDKISSDSMLIKEARALRCLARKHKRLFIVNDRADIALLTDADGVHLGQEDMPIKYARKMLPRKIIGVSTHSLRQALKAEKDGADYIGIGPIFKSPSKIGSRPIGQAVLKRVKKRLAIPFFAIGGINAENLGYLKNMGVNRIAVISAAIRSKDIYNSTNLLKRELERS